MWMKETAADGSPIWRGTDSVYNQHRLPTLPLKLLRFALLGALAFFIFALLVLDPWTRIGSKLSALFWVFTMFGVGAMVISRIVKSAERKRHNKKFVGAKWMIVVANNQIKIGLSHTDTSDMVSENIPLDKISRVEICKTADYTLTRIAEVGFGYGQHVKVSEHEWQTFLFLNDGTRRPIYHANADRDGCAALAASIREYLETARPRVLAPAVPDAPPRSGFDL